MNYVTEKDGTILLYNKRLMCFGRTLTILVTSFWAYALIFSLYRACTTGCVNEKFVRSAFILLFVALFLIFLCSLIGSRYTTISEKGIDTYRDLFFFKFWKRHLDPGEYSLILLYRRRVFTTDIYMKIGKKKRAIYSFMFWGCNTNDFVEQLDEALSHLASFSKGEVEVNQKIL